MKPQQQLDESGRPAVQPLIPRLDSDEDPRQFRAIPARQLRINGNAQRDLDDAERVARMRNEFDWARFECLTVVQGEDDSYTVVEGQHRARVRQEMNLDGPVPCMVVMASRTVKQQAELGLEIARGRLPHSAYQMFMQAYMAGHEHEVFAVVMLEKYGVRVGKAPSAMTISAVATVRSIIHGGAFSPEYGAGLLGDTIAILLQTWPTYDHDSNCTRWNRHLLLCVAETLIRYTDVDWDRFSEALKVKPAVQWVNLGKGTHDEPAWVVIARGVGAQYNRGRRKGRIWDGDPDTKRHHDDQAS